MIKCDKETINLALVYSLFYTKALTTNFVWLYSYIGILIWYLVILNQMHMLIMHKILVYHMFIYLQHDIYLMIV